MYIIIFVIVKHDIVCSECIETGNRHIVSTAFSLYILIKYYNYWNLLCCMFIFYCHCEEKEMQRNNIRYSHSLFIAIRINYQYV